MLQYVEGFASEINSCTHWNSLLTTRQSFLVPRVFQSRKQARVGNLPNGQPDQPRSRSGTSQVRALAAEMGLNPVIASDTSPHVYRR